jgi:hypothetical protein
MGSLDFLNTLKAGAIQEAMQEKGDTAMKTHQICEPILRVEPP